VKKVVLTTAAGLAAVFSFVTLTLPPRTLRIGLDAVDPGLKTHTVSGAFHIHTSRSDGAGTKQDVAAAAARSGLKFVVLTDHGDATRPLDPPEYIGGVLCLDGVEISTNGGHYAAIDMQPAPYPLGGEPSAVVEDVRRLGGFGVAAHPDHVKKELAWTDWSAPFDGIEWINGAAEWSDESRFRPARVVFDYLLRPGPALASLLDRPVATMERWDALEKRHRNVVALAAVDAHGSAQLRNEGIQGFGVGPSYEASFRSMSNRVLLERPLTSDVAADARLVVDAIRAGRLYSVIDAISPDVVLSLSDDPGFAAASPLPAGARAWTFEQGRRRRIEVHMPSAPGNPPVPWVVSNWTGPREPAVIEEPLYSETVALPTTSEWRVEKDPGSSGRVSAAGEVIALEYKLRSDERASQFVAAAADVHVETGFNALRFRGRATHPMRVSVQLRFSPDGSRWTRSVYLEAGERDLEIPVSSMVPAERASAAMPALTSIQSILFVVDLVNARPGDGGSFSISNLQAVR
jgi:hypothetical protein